MRLTRAQTTVICLLLATGCGESRDPVVMVDDKDPAMNAAMAKARSTAKQFIEKLQAPANPKCTAFAVKKQFTDKNGTEHFWLTDVSYDGKLFHGEVNNDPEIVRNVKLGDKTTVAPGEISDWMYINDGRLVGGYTIRVLYDKASPKERVEMKKSLPFKLD
jgi:uncharacterized protein YegJ (DUF2314 family)